MKTKINISPEMREFNEAVEACDMMTDYAFDRSEVAVLMEAIKSADLPSHANWLANAIAGIAVKVRPSCRCGNPDASWHGDNYNLRQFMCDKCWSEEQSAFRHKWLNL